MPFGSAAVAPPATPATPAPADGQAVGPSGGSPGIRPSPPPRPPSCGRPDSHTPVVVGGEGLHVAPLLVVTLTPATSDAAVAEGSVDPSCGHGCGTPILQEIVIKEWKEVNMGELFETSGLSAVLHIFAEKECNPLMTLGN